MGRRRFLSPVQSSSSANKGSPTMAILLLTAYGVARAENGKKFSSSGQATVGNDRTDWQVPQNYDPKFPGLRTGYLEAECRLSSLSAG